MRKFDYLFADLVYLQIVISYFAILDQHEMLKKHDQFILHANVCCFFSPLNCLRSHNCIVDLVVNVKIIFLCSFCHENLTFKMTVKKELKQNQAQ